MKKNYIRESIWVIVFGILIIAGYSLPDNILEETLNFTFLKLIFSDPFIHIYSFGVFALILGMKFFRERKETFPYARVGVYTLGFGIAIEFYQIFLPYRHFEFIDIVFDIMGIGAAFGILIIASAIRNKN